MSWDMVSTKSWNRTLPPPLKNQPSSEGVLTPTANHLNLRRSIDLSSVENVNG